MVTLLYRWQQGTFLREPWDVPINIKDCSTFSILAKKIGNRDVAIDIELNLFKEESSVTEKLVLEIKLTIFEYCRDRNISIYI